MERLIATLHNNSMRIKKKKKKKKIKRKEKEEKKSAMRLSHSDRHSLSGIGRRIREYRKRDNFIRKIKGIESTFRDYGIAPLWIKAHPFDRIRDTFLLFDMKRLPRSC